MNVHKRLLAILLVLVVVLMMPISAQANSLVAAMDDLYDQYVISYMKNVMHSNVTIRSKSDVKNLNQEREPEAHPCTYHLPVGTTAQRCSYTPC